MSKKIAQSWLEASYSDLLVIEEIVHNDYLTHMVAFHSQQSIEKSIKAILELQGFDIPKKHDLIQLCYLVSDFTLESNDDLLEELNELYIESRYPGSLGLLPNGKPSMNRANEFFQLAQNIYKKSKTLVESRQ